MSTVNLWLAILPDWCDQPPLAASGTALPTDITNRLDRLPPVMAHSLRSLQPADVVRGLAVRALLHQAWAPDQEPARFLARWQTDENGLPSIPGFPAFNASHAGRLTAVAMRGAVRGAVRGASGGAMPEARSGAMPGATPGIDPGRPSAEGQNEPVARPLGLDVERIRPVEFGLLRSYMTDLEWEDIERHEDPRARFYHFWTAKEALMKAEGLGFRLPIEEIALRGDAAMIRGRRWHLSRPDWPAEVPAGYAWHLATPEAEPHIQLRCLPWEHLWAD